MSSASVALALALCVGGCDGASPEGGADASGGLPDGAVGGEPDAPVGADGGTADGGPVDAEGACSMIETAVPNEGWDHVTLGGPVEHAHNPPASGQHYSEWAAWKVFTAPVPRGYWVHNIEHGGIVLLYGPDASTECVEALAAAYDAIPDDAKCGHKRALLTPDPLLGVDVAAIAADVVLLGDCVDQAAILAFVDAHRGKGPEDVCPGGTYQ